jgi:cytochrome c
MTISTPGNYVLELRVSDDHGGVGTANLPVIAGNTAPEVRFLEPQDGDFFTPGQPLRYRVEARDAEDGSSADYEEIFEPRTFVSARWGRGDGKENNDEPGLALMKQSDCFNCHAVEQKIVGPPLLEVANRYRGQSGALEASVQRVQRGSSGVWSEIPMLPHEALTTDQLQLMVRWIFALEPGKGGAGTVRGLTGLLQAPPDDKLRVATLEATYTDAGRAPAGSLNARTTVKLRSRRLQAELADEIRGAKVLGPFVGSIDDGHFLRFARVNLTGSARATCRVASAGVGGQIEIRAGSAHGELLGSLEVKPTGGWDKWIELSTPLKPAERGDVFVVFANPGKGGLMNLDWVRFE